MTTLQDQALRAVGASSSPVTFAVIHRETHHAHEGSLWRCLETLRARGLVVFTRGRWRISIYGRMALERKRGA